MTGPACRMAGPREVPVSASQTRAVLSSDAVTTNFPSRLNAADTTGPAWRIAEPTASPVSASHTWALSPDPVTTHLPP